MGVFMGIQVRDDNTGGLQLANLCRGFGFNIIIIDSAPDKAQGEAVQAFVKAAILELFIRQGRVFFSNTGEPSTRTTWQPTLSRVADVTH